MTWGKRRHNMKGGKIHEIHESPSGNQLAMGGEWDSQYAPDYPGAREEIFVDAQNYDMSWLHDPGNIRDNVDWAIEGQAGDTKATYGLNITTPTTVDAHDFRGAYATIRRLPDWHDGPVGGDMGHYNAILPILYAMQEASHYYPSEVAQADLIKAV